MGAGRFGQGVCEAVDDRGGLFVGDRERRQQAYDAGVAAAEFDDESTAQAFVLHGRGEFGRGRCGLASGPAGRFGSWAGHVDQFDADHQTAAAHVADAGVFGGEALELAAPCGRPGAAARSARRFSRT